MDMKDLALPSLLQTLTHAQPAGDTRLRETIRYILKQNQSILRIRVDALLDALKGPVPTLGAMAEADKLLHQLEKGKSAARREIV